ncbi:hypothetical protein DFH27DRAFT_528077 [Peziza echinospora]|nr:hypothetical protein DFH27DRAFT_528077 [Peziza echinospora]
MGGLVLVLVLVVVVGGTREVLAAAAEGGSRWIGTRECIAAGRRTDGDIDAGDDANDDADALKGSGLSVLYGATRASHRLAGPEAEMEQEEIHAARDEIDLARSPSAPNSPRPSHTQNDETRGSPVGRPKPLGPQRAVRREDAKIPPARFLWPGGIWRGHSGGAAISTDRRVRCFVAACGLVRRVNQSRG